MNADEFEAFYDALIHAECVNLHDFEKETYFEGCMPIEEMARRGKKIYGKLSRKRKEYRPRRKNLYRTLRYTAYRLHEVRRNIPTCTRKKRKPFEGLNSEITIQKRK